MPVTLKDVAERAGVSRSAVSRTFTEGASVSFKTRAKVEKAADELGYSPNVLARSLTTRRTSLIGLVSSNFKNPMFLEIFDLFTDCLQKRGLRPLIVNLSKETEPQNTITMLRQYSVDGVIIASSTLPPKFVHDFKSAKVPLVHSFGRYSRASGVDVIGIDNVACGRMAAETLVRLGYRRIGFMGGPRLATTTVDRHKGFVRELEKHAGIDVSVSYCDNYSFEHGRREMQRLLRDGPAEAYFCGDDVLSIGALSAIEEAGLSVPDDVGLIGFNDMAMSSWQNIDLTTVHQPLTDIIEASVDRIVEIIAEPDLKPRAELFPCRIIERGTLRAAPD